MCNIKTFSRCICGSLVLIPCYKYMFNVAIFTYYYIQLVAVRSQNAAN